jgi:hypothetical protein
MQLLLNLEERKVVTRALEKCLAHARGEECSRQRETANRLLDRILENDLRLSTDELEDLSDLLSACKMELKKRISVAFDPKAKTALQDQQKTLEHAADKVTEACMMA